MLDINKLIDHWEMPFHNIMQDMSVVRDPNSPNIIIWFKNNEWYLEQNGRSNLLYCDYTRVWKILEQIHPQDYRNTQLYIEKLVKKYYHIDNLTPASASNLISWWMMKYVKQSYIWID